MGRETLEQNSTPDIAEIAGDLDPRNRVQKLTGEKLLTRTWLDIKGGEFVLNQLNRNCAKRSKI